MSLGQMVFQNLWLLLLNNWPLLISLILAVDLYMRYFYINRNTDNVDLMCRYLYLKMERRYGRRT